MSINRLRQAPINFTLIIPREVNPYSHGAFRSCLYNISKLSSLQGTFWRWSFVQLQNYLSFDFPFRFLNSASGSISNIVTGSFRDWAYCGVSQHPRPFFISEKADTKTHFSLQNLPLHLFQNLFGECIWKMSPPPAQSYLPLCVASSKYNLCLETRVLSKLFWKTF